jgi:thymidylate synthase
MCPYNLKKQLLLPQKPLACDFCTKVWCAHNEDPLHIEVIGGRKGVADDSSTANEMLMHITANTLDDLLRPVFSKLLASRDYINPTRGKATEATAVLLQLTNPRARLSRTETKSRFSSCIGELLWYLAKTKDLKFISYYLSRYQEESEDGRTVYGGYGPRLFDMRGTDQIKNVLTLLKKNRDSRRAVIQLFDAADIAKKHKEIPCTCTLQFMIRRGRLHMLTNMRSNDAFLGLPHDVFAFTMLQEIMARSLGLEPGIYSHAVGSLHLYKGDRIRARQYLHEGWQSTADMPPMPRKNPWNSIGKVVRAERAIRCGKGINIGRLRLNSFWADILRLLQIYKHSKKKETDPMARIKRKMSARVYDSYIDDMIRRLHENRPKEASPT